jgi:hypothetical protein
MPKVRVNVSIFSSDVDAFGDATGRIEIDQIPSEGMPFPWPESLTTQAPEWFTGPDAALYPKVTFVDGVEETFLLNGIVCSSTDEAKRCARLLESVGLFVYEYH